MNNVKKNLINTIKKNHTLLFLLRSIRFLIFRIEYFYDYLIYDVDNKMIFFESYMGRQYSCNPKAIYENLIINNKYKDYLFVWAFKNPNEFQYLSENKNTIIVKYGSHKYYKYYSKAKYWVTNSRLNEKIIKKNNQVYIQCWHGTPLKKLGFDIKVQGGNAMNSNKDIRKKYKIDSKRYTYLISPSKFCSDKFASAFNLSNKRIIKELGYPRNDFLIAYTRLDKNNLKKKLHIPLKKKVILYAPTWRDNQHKFGLGYTYKLGIDFDKLNKKLKNNYIILFRTHYFVANEIDLSKYNDFIINVSNYEDINDLYIISDLLITDYSSSFFDYAILNKPIIFFMYDLFEYKTNLRDFYLELNELPGPIVKSNDELINCILNIDSVIKKYRKKYLIFNKKFNYLNDGHSSERVISECIK